MNAVRAGGGILNPFRTLTESGSDGPFGAQAVAAMGTSILVGMGQVRVARESGWILVARSIGSAAALAVYDPIAKVGGLLYWMLPDSALAPDRAVRSPAVFADTGFKRLLAEIEAAGGERSRLTAAVAGAASLPEGGEFDVGSRNQEAVSRLLKDSTMHVSVQDIGGVSLRDLSLELSSGRFVIRNMHA